MAEVAGPSSLSHRVREWRQKASKAPPIPRERHNFEIPEEYKKLESGEIFLLHDSGVNDEKRMLIFGTKQGLQDLVKMRQWGMDGTFKCCPSIFSQLLTIHAQEKTFSVP
jgi:hypothetical protein